jgi:hypothetical protein
LLLAFYFFLSIFQDTLKAYLHGKKCKFADFKHCVRNGEYEKKWFAFEAAAQVE